MDTYVTLNPDGAILRIQLNRPDELNALNFELLRQLRDALQNEAVKPEYRLVVLSGAGRAFSAGADLRVEPGDLNVKEALSELYNPIVLAIQALQKPVVAVIDGVVAGAGLSLALACDLRIGTVASRYVVGFHGIGLTLDAGMSWFLPRLVGDARARELAFFNRTISGPEAREYGLLSELVTNVAEAEPFLQQLAAGPTAAFWRTKTSLATAWDNSLATQLEVEAQLQHEAAATPDFAEGIAAFQQRRTPTFGGEE